MKLWSFGHGGLGLSCERECCMVGNSSGGEPGFAVRRACCDWRGGLSCEQERCALHDADAAPPPPRPPAVLVGCKISDSVLGQSVYVGRGTRVESSLLLGNGAWMSDAQRTAAIEAGERVYGVGECARRGDGPGRALGPRLSCKGGQPACMYSKLWVCAALALPLPTRPLPPAAHPSRNRPQARTASCGGAWWMRTQRLATTCRQG